MNPSRYVQATRRGMMKHLTFFTALLTVVGFNCPAARAGEPSIDVPPPVQAFFKSVCKGGKVEKRDGKPEACSMGMASYNYECPEKKRKKKDALFDRRRSVWVKMVEGTFTAKGRKEALLEVSDSAVPHSRGGGYFVLMRKKGKKWKEVRRPGLTPGAVKFVASLPSKAGTDVLVLCSYDCWQECCTGYCEAVGFKKNGKVGEGTELFGVGETGEFSQEQKSFWCNKVEKKDLDGDGLQELQFTVKETRGKEGKKQQNKLHELKFKFDGKTLVPVGEIPEFFVGCG